jgi:hypothetical protein
MNHSKKCDSEEPVFFGYTTGSLFLTFCQITQITRTACVTFSSTFKNQEREEDQNKKWPLGVNCFLSFQVGYLRYSSDFFGPLLTSLIWRIKQFS